MSSKPTLDHFIIYHLGKGGWSPRNAWVREKGFKSLYVRMTKRYINGRMIKPVLDLASIEATKLGKGTFTSLVGRLRADYPMLNLFVESVFEQRFADKLMRLGFKQVGQEMNFVLEAKYDMDK